MIKRNVMVLASVVFLAASAAVAAPSQQTNEFGEMFQYGDSMYMWDKDSGGAVRMGAVWDGFGAEAQQATAVFQDGDYVFVRDAQTGVTINAGAVWDGAVASRRAAPSMIALKR